MSKAGEQFVCACCKDSFDIDSSKWDSDIHGPVCEDCANLMMKAVAYLKFAKVTPVATSTNVRRFKR